MFQPFMSAINRYSHNIKGDTGLFVLLIIKVLY